MKNILSIVLIFSFLIKGLTAQELIQKVYGEHGSNEDRGECIIATADGGSLVAGKAINPTTQYFDAFLMKLDENGEKMWYKTYSGYKNTVTIKVVQTPDGGFFFCGTEENNDNNGTAAVLWKVDKDGNLLLRKNSDLAPDEGYTQIISLSNRQFLFIGYRKATEKISKSDSKIILYQVDENGAIIREKEHIIKGNATPLEAIEAPDGSIMVFVEIENSFTNYLVTINLETNQYSREQLNGASYDKKMKSVKILANHPDYIFVFLEVNGGNLTLFKINRIINPNSYYISYHSLSFGEGNYSVEFSNFDSILIKHFSNFSKVSSKLTHRYFDIISDTFTVPHIDISLPINLKNVHSKVSIGDTNLFLMNDSLPINGERDFRVLNLNKLGSTYSKKWEQSFGNQIINHDEIFIKNCTSKSGNQIVLAQHYQPDLQYFILLTDPKGNQLNIQNIPLELPIEEYKIIDFQPTPDNGAAIFVSTYEDLRILKIAANGTLQSEIKMPLSNAIPFYKLIVRPNGYALYDNIFLLNESSTLYLLDENLIVTGYRKINFDLGLGAIYDAICLDNGSIFLIVAEFGSNPDVNESDFKIVITDNQGVEIKRNTLPPGEQYIYSASQLKLVNNGVLLAINNYSAYRLPELYKMDFEGELLWKSLLDGVKQVYYQNYIVDIKEIACKGIFTTVKVSYTDLQNSLLYPIQHSLNFNWINEKGKFQAKECASINPTFEPCKENPSISDYVYNTWSSKKVNSNDYDLVLESVVFPINEANFEEKTLNIVQNPSSYGHLCLNLTNDYAGDFTLEIFNTEGRLMKSYQENKPVGLWENSYFVPGLNIGTYFIRAQIGADNFQAKWINISK
jgi:hypothetical protein